MLCPVVLLLAVHPPADAIDRAMPASMEKHHAPGGVVAFVSKDQPEIIRAFGFADFHAKRAVDAQRTAFRTGSISKVFTGMAAQSLVAEGKLSLDDDVNGTLKDFQVPAAFGKPVTLRNLLTHTAGFDDRYIGKSARSFETAEPLGKFLSHFLPPRVMPPGEVYAYSNIGMALAGHMVETAAGRPFAEYANQAIFRPLRMDYSSFLMPANIRESAALPHVWNGHGYDPLPWDYLQDAPAGMHLGSGEDMARLIRWALEHQGHPVFQTLFTNHPRLQESVAWGWHRFRIRGLDAVGHDGGYIGARARLRVFLDHDGQPGFGYFVAVNSEAGGVLGDVENAILDELAIPENPLQEARSPVPTRWDRDVARFAGSYRFARYSRTSLTKVGVLMGLLGGDLTIGTTADGAITMPKLDGTPRRMVQVEPLLFQSLDDEYFCAFRADASGNITHLFTSGTGSFERVPWFESLLLQRGLFAVCFLVLLVLSFGFVRRRLLEEPLRRPAAWASNLLLIHLAGLGVVLQVLTTAEERNGGFMYGLPWPIWIVQTVSLVGAAAAVWYCREWLRNFRALSFGTLGVAASVGWLWILQTWNLIGFRF